MGKNFHIVKIAGHRGVDSSKFEVASEMQLGTELNDYSQLEDNREDSARGLCGSIKSKKTQKYRVRKKVLMHDMTMEAKRRPIQEEEKKREEGVETYYETTQNIQLNQSLFLDSSIEKSQKAVRVVKEAVGLKETSDFQCETFGELDLFLDR
jgi:hypothetical protein